MKVTDEAFELVCSGILSRERHRAVKKFDRKQMERYIASIYRSGFEDGAEACEKAIRGEAAAKHANPDDEYEEVKADWEDVLRVIGEVKGMTPKLLEDIDTRLKECF